MTARQYASDALKALQHVATKGKSESARVTAACALLDRGYGRPPHGLDMIPVAAVFDLKERMARVVATSLADEAELDRIEHEWSRIVVKV